jgi:hypothetical protein
MLYPFYSRNSDMTLSVGFYIPKKGEIDVRIVYESNTPLILNTTIKVTALKSMRNLIF